MNLLAAGDVAGARNALADALALWRGEPRRSRDRPSAAQRQRLVELRLLASEDLLAVRLARGEHAAVVADLEPLTARYPLRERPWALLLALYRSGRQAEALEALAARGALSTRSSVSSRPQECATCSRDPAAGRRPRRRRPGGSCSPRHARGAARPGYSSDATASWKSSPPRWTMPSTGRGTAVPGQRRPAASARRDSWTSSPAARRTLGAGVLWGRCSKRPGAPPYWPWTGALEPLGDEKIPKLDAAPARRAVPSCSPRSPPHCRTSAAKERPLLVVLDDLHRADEQSLLLLEFLAGEIAKMHVAIVATYVESADEPPELVALADHTAHHRLRLAPLEAEDVARFLEPTGAGELDASAVHAETGGNPRLVWQRVR